MSRQCVIMFVDMQDSTEFKYRHQGQPKIIHRTISRLYRVIDRLVGAGPSVKFTGDGAMVVYDLTDARDRASDSLAAVQAAVRIIQHIDRRNYYSLHSSPVHLRIGIASGDCEEITEGTKDFIGPRVDLAARLCDEASRDAILVDDATAQLAGFVNHGQIAPERTAGLDGTIAKCNRRLSLKGVPSDSADQHFWEIVVRKFANPASTDPFSHGIAALYVDRRELGRDFTPRRVLEQAKVGSDVWIAGRTLRFWTKIAPETLLELAAARDLRVHFMIASHQALQYLDGREQRAARQDLLESLPYFTEVLRQDAGQGNFEVFATDLLIQDGITCAELQFESDRSVAIGDHGETEFNRLVVLHDVNAAAHTPGSTEAVATSKAAILWTCICPGGTPQPNQHCMAHGLHRRTKILFHKERARRMTPETLELESTLQKYGEGSKLRNNHPRSYLPDMVPYFRAIRSGAFDAVPPPQCVQLQMSSRCSTWCQMCDHWRENREDDELSCDEWQTVLENLANSRVKTIVMSGGEPLVKDGIDLLIRKARDSGLRIGLLTSGTTMTKPSTIGPTPAVLDAIAQCVDWMALSIDGPTAMDQKIRNPALPGAKQDPSMRLGLIQKFCADIRSRNDHVSISATVTLQSMNVNMKLEETCEFIQDKLQIESVNFKFATGASDALADLPHYLLQTLEIEQFLDAVRKSSLPHKPGNNLAYLLKCVDDKIWDVQDIADGAPVRSFYAREAVRCFTPFLFSLIDYDGEVFPCCHLYRDNHVMDPKTREYRQQHSMGNVAETGDFNAVWNGPRYAEERRRLTRIDPAQKHFEPCGECTRHCQHNLALSRIETILGATPDLERELESLPRPTQPVWF